MSHLRRFLLGHQVIDGVSVSEKVTEHETIEDAHSTADLRANAASASRWRQELIDRRTGDRWTRAVGAGWMLDLDDDDQTAIAPFLPRVSSS